MPRSAIYLLSLLLSLYLPMASASEMPIWGEGEHSNFYVVKYTPGKKWNHRVDYWQQDGVEHHREHLNRLYDSDTLLLGGPLVDEPGSMMVIRARSLLHATSIALRDPMISRQILDIDVGGWRWEMSKMRHEYRQQTVDVDPSKPYHLNRIDPDIEIGVKE